MENNINTRKLAVFDLEKYEKKIVLTRIVQRIEKAEQNVKNGKIHDAKDVFKKLRDKYEY